MGLIRQRRYRGEVATLVTQSIDRHPLRLALTTGLVSAFFSVVYQAVEEFLSHPPRAQLKELLVIAVTSIGMLLAIEPILERIGPLRVRELAGRKDTILIQTGAFLTIAATSLLHGLLHAHLSESLSADGVVVLEQLLTALLEPTIITLAWIHGVRRERPRARWYGLIAGVLTALGLIIVAMLQLYFFRPPPALYDASARDAAVRLLMAAASPLWFIVPACAANGYLGGLATDRRWTAKAWSSVAIGLMIAAAVEAGLFLLASSFESHAVERQSLVALLAEIVVANLGWAIGLWVRPDADVLLRNP